MRERFPGWDETIIEMYTSGYSIREISNDIHWSDNFIRRRLAKNGIAVRPRGGNRKPKVAVKVLAETKILYVDQRKTVREVSKIMGVSTSTVLRRLDTLGIKRRPQGGTKKKSRPKVG